MQNSVIKQKIVIIGATSAMAEHCARLWVSKANVELVLVGRDEAKLKLIAADLKVRNAHTLVKTEQVDFLSASAVTTLANNICTEGSVDIVLIAHGNLPDQLACQADLNACSEAIHLNGLSPVLFAEAFAAHMQKVNRGTIAVIGSVAGDRGRKSNYVYGAAKGLVSRYVQGMQHRFASSHVKIVLIKPGPTSTPMTAHLGEKGVKMASVEAVAAHIVDGIEAGKSIVYTPAKWAIIMMIIRHLPNFIFKKLNL